MEKAITAEFQHKPFGITLAPLKNNNNITVLYDIEDDTQQQQLKDCKYYILCVVDDILVYDIISFENIITQIKNNNEMKMCFVPLKYINEFKDRFKWMPHFKFTTDYVGNGFVRLKITKWNANILHFEFYYCFLFMNGIDNPENVTIEPSLYRSLTFKINKLNKKNIVLIRIPQRSSNYFFCFQIRALCISQPNTTHMDMNTHKYTTLYERKLHIPFDAPVHQFKVGDIVQFSKTNDSFYDTGKIEKMVMENSIAIVLIKIRMENDEIKEQRYNINVDKLRMESRYRSKLLDLTDWIEISKSLLLKGRSEETINTFIAVYNGLIFYFKRHIYKERDVIFTEFIYDNDAEQDVASCSRYIAWNIIQYLGEDIMNDGMNVIKTKTIRCGLCGISNGYHIKMRLESIWIEELRNYMEVKRGNIPVNWSLTTSNYNGLGTMCDICQIGFHRLSYCFHCCVKITKKHDICLPCMNRNVVQFNRLNIVLNDLYDIHGLDTYCVLQIVSCLIGWINISN
eukprot:266328_1